MKNINGFSKLSKSQKVEWLNRHVHDGELDKFWLKDDQLQSIIDEFSENTVSNFITPYGIAPNFIINNRPYTVPMVIEESSVVAAASKAAKFWSTRGGFKSEVLGVTKVGHVHFTFDGESSKLIELFNNHKKQFFEQLQALNKNMLARGGGILSLELVDKTDQMQDYYQLEAKFDTCDAMGANFINSILEALGAQLRMIVHSHFPQCQLDIVMCILSNFTPECLVRCYVECDINDLATSAGLSSMEYAKRFYKACEIARVDRYRAVTHNKGIFNGIDAIVLATGNDFRAIEACGHAYAARDGQYRGLSQCRINEDRFIFEMTIPLALGTVGGLTSLHPLAKYSLKLLQNPSAQELMQIVAVVGLAQNFGALNSLITTGIQKGHMKMHLLNICKQLNASDADIEKTKSYFKDKIVSFSAVRDFIDSLKEKH